MAQPTSPTAHPPEPMRPTAHVGNTPGSVGSMGAPPGGVAGGSRPSMTGVQQTPDTAPADPVLFDDIEPVLLVRLYPHAKSGEESRGAAMQAGAAAHDAGLKLVAAQQEPIVGAEEPAPPPPAAR